MDEFRCFRCMGLFDAEIDKICPHCGYDQDEQLHNQDLQSALKPGTILNGKYYVGCVLGIGGFAITYMAYNLQNESKVAIKEYFPSNIASRRSDELTVTCADYDSVDSFKGGLNQFYWESRQLAKVGNHRSIVNVFEVFTENSTAYIVMEYVNGISLDEHIKQEGLMDYETLLEILLPICSSLDIIHTTDHIIHRDIAPDNIIVQPNGRGKLIDFGASSQITSINKNIILKHGYAPIEQYDVGDYCDASTDVYAMSAVIYHMLTGKRPPKSEDRKDAVEHGEPDPLVDPIALGADIPEELNAVIMNGLAIYRKDRPQSMLEFAEMLKPFVRKPVPPPPPPLPPRRPIWPIIASLVVVVAGIIVLLVYLFKQPPKPEDTRLASLPMADICNMTQKNAQSKIDEWEKTINEMRRLQGIYDTIKVELKVRPEKVSENQLSENQAFDNKIDKQKPAANTEINVLNPEGLVGDTLKIIGFLYEKDNADVMTNDMQIDDIPDVLGLEPGEAKADLEKWAEENGLSFTIETKVESQYNSTYLKDTVSRQSISPGEVEEPVLYGKIKAKLDHQGGVITLWLSKGQEPESTTTTTTATTTANTTRNTTTTTAPSKHTESPYTNPSARPYTEPGTTTSPPTVFPETTKQTTTTSTTFPYIPTTRSTTGPIESEVSARPYLGD